MKYGLIGKPLGHSFSREIHALIADYDYRLFEIDEDELPRFFQERDFSGINVTIPYKQAVIPFLDEISDEAKKIGAVNTIVKKEGKLFGFNTDFFGMRALIKSTGLDLENKTVLILGTGGTSKTAVEVSKSLGATEIVKVSRRKSSDTVTCDEAYEKYSGADVIINTTPVGMFPNADKTPVDIKKFKNLQGVIDAVYNPLRTNFVLDAESIGAKGRGGLYMLVAQAVYASALFLDKTADENVIDKTYARILKEKRNIVLCGMPSSGKTTVGKEIAKVFGKKFIDTDDVVVEKRKESISDIFEKYGEGEFRKEERLAIEELSKENGLVIATGGGAVLDENNVRALRRNGVILFLDRSLENLVATADRPLSKDKEKLKNLFEKRYDVYKSCADAVIPADGEIADVVEKIKGVLL
ncbi:MAG: shikimate kinase [Eubacteriales bacterium]|nr:shikimate kinase [Eubacteriales bacterium]